eukprot:TRINITY_DN2916_c0_g1_i1.p1 TRINITY_DN2916_c0_g1~~TRINITY_DN2916_c0_g1_i1.p1  ORF type:complete len:299 (+),score=90.07 TRINITY_DN2916_c0_g1_i1:58-897(+)
MAGLQLYVRVHGEVVPVDVDPDASVQEVMDRVAQVTGSEAPLLQFQGADLNPEDLIADTGVSQEATLEAVPCRVFRYKSDFDENGLFYFLGTLGLKEVWQNPDHGRRLVSCQKQPAWGRPASDFVGREGRYCRTDNVERPYFEVDISNVGCLVPTHYTLRHGRDEVSYVLKDWQLLGSPDGLEWVTLDEQQGCKSLRGEADEQQGTRPYFTGTFEVEGCVTKCTHFRVVGLGNYPPFDGRHTYLHLSGFELYGAANLKAGWESQERAETESDRAALRDQ